mmetsp:Transcript_29410/g.56465  ORF Transcript_29410/g.56465 Transcript_29410/m.56465 type:complete len:237 (+) Transcript_29410:344-1054(+)
MPPRPRSSFLTLEQAGIHFQRLGRSGSFPIQRRVICFTCITVWISKLPNVHRFFLRRVSEQVLSKRICFNHLLSTLDNIHRQKRNQLVYGFKSGSQARGDEGNRFLVQFPRALSLKKVAIDCVNSLEIGCENPVHSFLNALAAALLHRVPGHCSDVVAHGSCRPVAQQIPAGGRSVLCRRVRSNNVRNGGVLNACEEHRGHVGVDVIKHLLLHVAIHSFLKTFSICMRWSHQRGSQ